MDLQGFKNPDSILRPAPFWAINSKITPEETARQIADMIDVGLSGGFFHSRAGLLTDYLSDDWFAAMEAAIEVAREKDGYVWLYDEDLWPSGNAGGQVAAMKDEYRSTTLSAIIVAAGEPAPKMEEDQAVRYCYAIKSREGLKLNEFEAVPLDKIDDAKKHERLFIVRIYGQKIGWWSGESYANLLHPEAMRNFIEMTHDVYAKKLGREFGKRIPGIFTDEPQIRCGYSRVAWYEGLPEVYSKWEGRDFWKDLPYLFFDGPQARKARLLIHRTLLRQFLEAYSKPLFEWCEKHGIENTGHYNSEDCFKEQINYHAGGVMAHYRYQHAPGIDHLCRQVDGMLLTCKQVASAAHQLGRTRVLTEIFGVTRHTNTFEDFKWIGDYDLVHGANFFVPHLTWYSAKGRRKRDYPPVWNYQQTYWSDLKPLNDYFTRVAHALKSGKAVVDTVVLHPIESAVAARTIGIGSQSENRNATLLAAIPADDMSAAAHFDRMFRRTLEAILSTGLDADLGDEGYIDDMGAVEGNNFRIGEMNYKVVVVPPSTTWRPKTFDLLKKFVANGGKVVMVGEAPMEIDCEDAKAKWIELASHKNVMSLPCSMAEIQSALDEILPKTFSLRGADGTMYPHLYLQHRIDGDQEIFFIVNSDRSCYRDMVLTFKGARGKTIAIWDPTEGTCREVSGCPVPPNDLRYEFTLPPCGSVMLTLGGNIKAGHSEKEQAVCAPNAQVVAMPDEFEFERKDANVLVMDRISVSFDDGNTFEPEGLEWRVRERLAKRFGTEAALQWQPWVAIRKKLFDGKGGPIVMRYKFQSDIEKPKAFIVIEDIGKGKLTVNSAAVDTSNADWHWDRDFGKVEIGDYVKKGENIVDFRLDYDFLTEVEPAYIVGDFGVAMADPFRGKLIEEPKMLKVGSWSKQGYPFYSGRMVYKFKMEAESGPRMFLRLVRPSGTLYKVRVNGEDAGRILWRPWEVEITKLVRKGTNSIEIEVVSSLQNSWGPLHEKEGDDQMWCGPNAFEDEYYLKEEINSFDYGLLGGVEVVSG